jgi:hypothetical protein
MITTKLTGRLGNQMFEIANCIAYSLRTNQEWAIPDHTENSELWETYFTHFPKLDKSFNLFGWYREHSHGYTPIPKREQICFMGYFQSYKYFEDYKEQVLKEFEPAFANFEQGIIPNTVSLHFRLGDYLKYSTHHNIITTNYIQDAISYFPENTNFLVFSDGIDYCKQLLPDMFPNINFAYSENTNALQDLHTMSRCEHNIMSASTFSWWAAYMNKNPNKIVITPSAQSWFGEDNKHLDTSDIIPENWKQIKL